VALLAVTLLTKSCHDEQTQTVGVHESRWFGKVVADVWGKKPEYYVCHPQGGQEGGDLPRVQSEIAQDERSEDGEVELCENRQSHAHHDVDENGVLEQVQVEGFCHALVKSRQGTVFNFFIFRFVQQVDLFFWRGHRFVDLHVPLDRLQKSRSDEDVSADSPKNQGHTLGGVKLHQQSDQLGDEDGPEAGDGDGETHRDAAFVLEVHVKREGVSGFAHPHAES
jgi:hypothetical protein